MKILVVDDEQLARERLKGLISELSDEHLVIEAGNGLVALNKIEAENPDVVLLDIRMPVMDGLETAFHMTSLHRSPAIIFTTAYQDHAIEAFEAKAVDYLLKPIRKGRLQQALESAQLLNRARIASLENNTERTHISTTNQGKIQLVPVEDVLYFKAEQKYVTIGWSGGEILTDEALKSFESEFPDRFIRIHRNALVALEFIDALEKDSQGGFSVRLRGSDERLIVSRRHLHNVRQILRQK